MMKRVGPQHYRTEIGDVVYMSGHRGWMWFKPYFPTSAEEWREREPETDYYSPDAYYGPYRTRRDALSALEDSEK